LAVFDLMPKLYHFSLDPFSRRLRLALAEYGLGFELIEQKPWEPDAALYGLNAAGSVPVLVTDAGEPLSGIEAVSEYLEETREDRPSLIPGDALGRAEVRRLTGWFDTKFYAEVSEPVLTEKAIRRFLSREAGGGSPDMNRVRSGLTRLKAHLDYVGALIDRRRWLAGDDLSIADLAAAAHLSCLDYLGDVPWSDFTAVKGWYQRLKSRPSFRPLLSDSIRGIAPPAAYADLDF
jgi:glutathione S-transferase